MGHQGHCIFLQCAHMCVHVCAMAATQAGSSALGRQGHPCSGLQAWLAAWGPVRKPSLLPLAQAVAGRPICCGL